MALAAGRQSLLSQGLGFDPGQFQMIFVTDKDSLLILSLQALCFPPFSIIPPLLHTYLTRRTNRRAADRTVLLPVSVYRRSIYPNPHLFIALYKRVPFHIADYLVARHLPVFWLQGNLDMNWNASLGHRYPRTRLHGVRI